MERVARVLVKFSNEEIDKWAKEEERPREEVIDELKGAFKDFINKYNNRNRLTSDIDFIEWEDFCPKCESTFIEQIKKYPFRRYRCTECEYTFEEGELER